MCDGSERGWLAGGRDQSGRVSQPGADAERYRCACLHCTQGLTGRGDGYQCSLDWGRSSISYASVHNMRNMFVTLFTKDIKYSFPSSDGVFNISPFAKALDVFH